MKAWTFEKFIFTEKYLFIEKNCQKKSRMKTT